MIINCLDCNKKIKVVGKRVFTQKRCVVCYHKYQHNNKPYNFKGASICICGDKKAWHAIKCRKCATIGLPNCIICGDILSVYKNSNQYNTGVCQKCYKGELTERWNFQLTQEERNRDRNKKPEYYEWRKKIFKRDKYTCQKCGDNKGGNLCSHHIENWIDNKDLRFDINNGITLCSNCHISFHKKYGWYNNDVIQLMEFSGFNFKIA